jgi:hypothetical protein
MARAPCAVSSAGWKTTSSLPLQASRARASQGGGAGQPGDVHVVAAGVHDRDLGAGRVRRRGGAGVGEAGGLADGQGVHVGPQHHGRPVAVGEQPDDAGAPDLRGDLVALLPQPARGQAGRPPLLERVWSGVLVFDAVGLAVFCVSGASKAVEFDLGPAQAIILGAITGIGGGLLRDVLLRRVPSVRRQPPGDDQ